MELTSHATHSFKVQDSVIFSIFTESLDHRTILGRFHHPQQRPSPSPAPLTSTSLDIRESIHFLPILAISYTWNHVTRGLL